MTRNRSTLAGRCLFAALGALLLVSWTAPALALDSGPYSVEVLVDGRPLVEYAARGMTYVEALEGREYSVRMTNHTGERIAIALTLDGLNSVDAKTTTARDASKWILGPYRTLVIDGWQTSSASARRFFFTTEEMSYGSWLGRTKNLGIISAAVFHERRPTPVPYSETEPPTRRRSAADSAPQGKPAPGSSRAEAEERAPSSKSSGEAGRAEGQADDSDRMAATGIGRRVDRSVRRVRFDAEAAPAAMIELRYEFHDALVQLGVLPYRQARDELDRRERSRGFIESGFAPDPYRP